MKLLEVSAYWIFVLVFIVLQECSCVSMSTFSTSFRSVMERIRATNTTSERTGTKENDKKLMLISFVNGIYHSEEDLQRIAGQLQVIFNEEIRPFYNPSSGWWVTDATKAGFNLVVKPNDLEIAKQLAEHLRRALNDVRKNGRVLHIAHSGGAILTYLAAKHHLTHTEAGRIDVITLGGGRSLTHKYFRGRLVNYYASNDPLLQIDQRAGNLFKSTTTTTTHTTAKTSITSDIKQVREKKHNTSFVFIPGKAKHPIHDHSAEGETYRVALDIEALEFKARLVLMRSLDQAERDWMRLSRKAMANITGVHHFWDQFSVRSIRKTAATVTRVHGFFSRKDKLTNASANDEAVNEDFVFQQSFVASQDNNESSDTTAGEIEEAPVSPVWSPLLPLVSAEAPVVDGAEADSESTILQPSKIDQAFDEVLQVANAEDKGKSEGGNMRIPLSSTEEQSLLHLMYIDSC